tara:strand:- start:3358 stop:4542 length:1185 start_codon:yes stop_codon:yes gene_type:complete
MTALKNIRIIDLTRVLAGPFATMTFADLGAEVIKVEPFEGDEARNFGPLKDGISGYFENVNRGKKSIVINLKDPIGKEILLNLIKKSDILIENFRPGVMKKFGLDYDSLHQKFPNLIYAACSGFGQTGPYSEKGAYDMIIQGMGGIVSITGEPDRPPVRVGVSIGDIAAALYSCIGILVALLTRNQTGKGQLVDISMMDCQIALLENAIARYDMTGIIPSPLGARHPSITPFQALQTKNGWIMIAAGNNNLWKKLCQVLNLDILINDDRFKDNNLRTLNHQELDSILAKRFKTENTEIWLNRLSEADIPAGPIQNIKEVMEDPQVKARKMITEILHPIAGPLRIASSPLNLSETPPHIESPAPALGQHTNLILKQLINADDQEISKWRDNSIIL